MADTVRVSLVFPVRRRRRALGGPDRITLGTGLYRDIGHGRVPGYQYVGVQ